MVLDRVGVRIEQRTVGAKGDDAVLAPQLRDAGPAEPLDHVHERESGGHDQALQDAEDEHAGERDAGFTRSG